MGRMSQAVETAHRTIEQTELAKQMESGAVDKRAYVRYLRSSYVVWKALADRYELARSLGVADRLFDDLEHLTGGDLQMDRASPCAENHAAQAGMADLRVLGLGLCYGGKIMAKRISSRRGFPVSHFYMPDGSLAALRSIEAHDNDVTEAFRRTTEWYSDAV